MWANCWSCLSSYEDGKGRLAARAVHRRSSSSTARIDHVGSSPRGTHAESSHEGDAASILKANEMSDELQATIILSELLRLFTQKPSESGNMSRFHIDLAKQKIKELSHALD